MGPPLSQTKNSYGRYANEIYEKNARQLPASSRDSGMSFEAMFGHRGAGGPEERFAGRRNSLARAKAKAQRAASADPYAITSGATDKALAKQKTRLGKAGKNVLEKSSFGRVKGEFSN